MTPILAPLLAAGVSLLPNTSGRQDGGRGGVCRPSGAEALGTHWLKLEIHPDARWLLPDPIETLESGGAAGPRRVRGAALLRRRSGAV
ncbi:hypothetical protein LNP74_14380 [Klebsiella pneumoniae subsp. pneumoniae]|nr:hypothetical protein [Klebsiella pneumoniae subsp. pneumoniae]